MSRENGSSSEQMGAAPTESDSNRLLQRESQLRARLSPDDGKEDNFDSSKWWGNVDDESSKEMDYLAINVPQTRDNVLHLVAKIKTPEDQAELRRLFEDNIRQNMEQKFAGLDEDYIIELTQMYLKTVDRILARTMTSKPHDLKTASRSAEAAPDRKTAGKLTDPMEKAPRSEQQDDFERMKRTLDRFMAPWPQLNKFRERIMSIKNEADGEALMKDSAWDRGTAVKTKYPGQNKEEFDLILSLMERKFQQVLKSSLEMRRKLFG